MILLISLSVDMRMVQVMIHVDMTMAHVMIHVQCIVSTSHTCFMPLISDCNLSGFLCPLFG